jgi:dual specificity MAP kinase phosphatase
MERCRSSEAVLGQPVESGREARGGRGREPKATSLLFHTVPSGEQIEKAQRKGEQVYVEETNMSAVRAEDASQDEKMEVDSEPARPVMDGHVDVEISVEVDPSRPAIWGMPKWGWEEERKEVRRGVRLVGVEEVRCIRGHQLVETYETQLPALIDQHAMVDTPSHVLFPWLHGISDDGQKGRDMAAFFG